MTFRFLVIRMNPIHSRDLNKIYKVKKKKENEGPYRNSSNRRQKVIFTSQAMFIAVCRL